MVILSVNPSLNDLKNNDGVVPQNLLDNTVNKYELLNSIINELRRQGFVVDKDYLSFDSSSKENIRNLHQLAVNHILEKKRNFIIKYDKLFVKEYIANGYDLIPQDIEPQLEKVTTDKESNIFNWIKLHWSIPVSSGYGRRMRYIVKDKNNGKIIGIIGLGDPVYALRDRETFIGWDNETKSKKLKNIMDAFVLGAVPPYNMILCGKLIASLLSSKEIFLDFCEKYGGKKTLIREEIFDGKLAGITTSSALGKSSIYDRIKIPGGACYLHIGWTSGSGDFQFLNGYYNDLLNIVRQEGYTGKNAKWGSGTRSRRAVIRKALMLLGISRRLMYHGIKRELFFIPQGSNWKQFLGGGKDDFEPYLLSSADISKYMKSRWVIPRANRDKTFLNFKNLDYSIQVPHLNEI